MAEIHQIIDLISDKCHGLVQQNQALVLKRDELMADYQKKESENFQLLEENKVVKNELNSIREEKSKIENELKTQIQQLEERLKERNNIELNDSKKINVEGIVKEIDDCIRLINSDL